LLPRVSLRLAALTTLTLMAGTTMVSRSFAFDRADFRGAASLIRRADPHAPVVVMDPERRVAHRGCLGFYLDRDQQPIPVAQAIKVVASCPPESLWYVIETAPWNCALPVPNDLTQRYSADRTWTFFGVTVERARLRPTESVTRRDDAIIRLR
jgi:hypothetical protein